MNDEEFEEFVDLDRVDSTDGLIAAFEGLTKHARELRKELRRMIDDADAWDSEWDILGNE